MTKTVFLTESDVFFCGKGFEHICSITDLVTSSGAPPRTQATSRTFSCPSPGGEDDRYLSCQEGGARGSWSLTRPPVARAAANFRTVVTLKRGPSLCLSPSRGPHGPSRRARRATRATRARPHGPQVPHRAHGHTEDWTPKLTPLLATRLGNTRFIPARCVHTLTS